MKLEEIGFYTLSDNRAANASIDSQMQRCEVIITDKCNFRCPYCRKLKEGRELSVQEVKRLIDLWCYKQPLFAIRFSGGEPTLHYDLPEMVGYAREKHIARIAISTNGSAELELYKYLIKLGVNDISISLDACCSEVGDKMSGGVEGSWKHTLEMLQQLSLICYVTVGIVITKENEEECLRTIRLAHSCGVDDIRVIPAAQENKEIMELSSAPKFLAALHPILKYRVDNAKEGKPFRGKKEEDNPHCPLVFDDSIVCGDYHYPCVIYMREGGDPIGRVSDKMREERWAWGVLHNTMHDPICKSNCLDVCVDYNNKYLEFHKKRESE